MKRKILIGSAIAALGIGALTAGITIPIVLNNKSEVVIPTPTPDIPPLPDINENTDPSVKPTEGPVVKQYKTINMIVPVLDEVKGIITPQIVEAKVLNKLNFINQEYALENGIEISFLDAVAKNVNNGHLEVGFLAPDDGETTALKYYMGDSEVEGFNVLKINGKIYSDTAANFVKRLYDENYYNENPNLGLFPRKELDELNKGDYSYEFLGYYYKDDFGVEKRVDEAVLKDIMFAGTFSNLDDQFKIPELYTKYNKTIKENKIDLNFFPLDYNSSFVYRGSLDNEEKNRLREELMKAYELVLGTDYNLLGFRVNGAEQILSVDQVLDASNIREVTVALEKLESIIRIEKSFFNKPLNSTTKYYDEVVVLWKNGDTPIFNYEVLTSVTDDNGYNFYSDGNIYYPNGNIFKASDIKPGMIDVKINYEASLEGDLTLLVNEAELIAPQSVSLGYFGLFNPYKLAVPFECSDVSMLNLDSIKNSSLIFNTNEGGVIKLSFLDIDLNKRFIYYEIDPYSMNRENLANGKTRFEFEIDGAVIVGDRIYNNLNSVELRFNDSKIISIETDTAKIKDLILMSDTLNIYNYKCNNIVLGENIHVTDYEQVKNGLFRGDLAEFNGVIDLNGFTLTLDYTSDTQYLFERFDGTLKNGTLILNGLNKISSNDDRYNSAFAMILGDNAVLENVTIASKLGFDLNSSLLSTNYVIGVVSKKANMKNVKFNVTYGFELDEIHKENRINNYRKTNNYSPIGRIEGYYTQNGDRLNYPINIYIEDIKISNYLKENKNETFEVKDGLLGLKDGIITEKYFYDGVELANSTVGEEILHSESDFYLGDETVTYSLGRLIPTINMAIRSLSYDGSLINESEGYYLEITVDVLKECDYNVAHEVFNHLSRYSYKKGNTIITKYKKELEKPY